LAELAAPEIQALARIVDELDYYQILHLERDASASDIKKAFHQTSRSFHPDANRSLEDERRADCARIAKRVTEAYCVLRDPRRRRAYDQRIESGEGLRIQLAEAKAAHQKHASEQLEGKTPGGRQFYQKAIDDMSREDWKSAAQNLQMALTFEPTNELFKKQLEQARSRR